MCDGGEAELVRLSAGGLTASVLTYGATLVGLEAPGPNGLVTNCVVTLADPGDLANPALNPHLGGIVGPYANRIAEASFELDRVVHALEANEGPNTLHGGTAAWDRRRWGLLAAEADATSAWVTLALDDPDGSGGFPGGVEVTALYSLRADHTLTLVVTCTTDRATVVAPTSHVYWNLAGAGTVEDHRMSLAADSVLELGPGQLPTGAALAVAGGPWDLRAGVRLGDRLGAPELDGCGGYDHTFLVRAGPNAAGGPDPADDPDAADDSDIDEDPDIGRELPLVARLVDPAGGRSLEMRSDQPAVHLYTGNHLDGEPGQRGPIPRHGGVCLEAGQVPNGPNLATIAGPIGPIPVDVTLRPGTVASWTTSWRLIDDRLRAAGSVG